MNGHPRPTGRCTLCGRRPVGVIEVSLHGELTCVSHAVVGRCVLCTRPHEANPAPNWQPIIGSRLRCPTCAVGAQSSAKAIDQIIEEGVCELFAYAWLKRQSSALATAMLMQFRDNPDPIYGNGYRTVHESVRRNGIGTVLDAVLRTGKLP